MNNTPSRASFRHLLTRGSGLVAGLAFSLGMGVLIVGSLGTPSVAQAGILDSMSVPMNVPVLVTVNKQGKVTDTSQPYKLIPSSWRRKIERGAASLVRGPGSLVGRKVETQAVIHLSRKSGKWVCTGLVAVPVAHWHWKDIDPNTFALTSERGVMVFRNDNIPTNPGSSMTPVPAPQVECNGGGMPGMGG